MTKFLKKFNPKFLNIVVCSINITEFLKQIIHNNPKFINNFEKCK